MEVDLHKGSTFAFTHAPSPLAFLNFLPCSASFFLRLPNMLFAPLFLPQPQPLLFAVSFAASAVFVALSCSFAWMSPAAAATLSYALVPILAKGFLNLSKMLPFAFAAASPIAPPVFPMFLLIVSLRPPKPSFFLPIILDHALPAAGFGGIGGAAPDGGVAGPAASVAMAASSTKATAVTRIFPCFTLCSPSPATSAQYSSHPPEVAAWAGVCRLPRRHQHEAPAACANCGLRKIGKPGSSPFPADAQNGPETTQLWRKFAPIVRVSVGFACGAGGLACGAS